MTTENAAYVVTGLLLLSSTIGKQIASPNAETKLTLQERFHLFSGEHDSFSEKRSFLDPRALTTDQLNDLTDYPDVMMVVQRSGMSSTDYEVVKNLIRECARSVRSVGPGKFQSRFAVMAFSAITQDLLRFKDCCNRGLGQLAYMVRKTMFLLHQEAITVRVYDKKNHTDASTEAVDLDYALFALRERHIKDRLLPQYKPTVLLLLLNFQSDEMSFNKLNAAAKELQTIRALGIQIVTIIIDPLQNRQRQVKEDFPVANNNITLKSLDVFGYSQSQEHLKKLFKYIDDRQLKPDKGKEHVLSLLEKFGSEKARNLPRLGGIVQFHELRETPETWHKDLVLRYAQAMSSIPEHGFKFNKYSDIARQDVYPNLVKILTNAKTWFGVGETKTSCSNTKNEVRRIIWSPGYHTLKRYPNGKQCFWTIRAPVGQIVSLKFEEFRTESTFDRLTLHDGETALAPVIKTISGQVAGRGISLTINSNQEYLFLNFETDGGTSNKGFFARWDPMIKFEFIDSARVAFLLDISTSITNEDRAPVTKWIDTATRYFIPGASNRGKKGTKRKRAIMPKGAEATQRKGTSFGNTRKRVEGQDTEKKPSLVGLLSFDKDAKIVKHIEHAFDRKIFLEMLGNLKTENELTTHIGRAIDRSRTTQFLIRGRDDGQSKKDDRMPRRVLFIFSDWQSVDDPLPSVKRLCQSDIIPVLIGIGTVNMQSREDLHSKCGLAFYIDVPVPEVIDALKKIWGIFRPTTTTVPVTTTTLPSKPPTTTTTTTTTTATITTIAGVEPTTTRTYPYTGTYPTLPPMRLYTSPPDYFDYYGVAGLLIAIGAIETITLFALICYDQSLEVPLLEIESTESMVKARKREEDIEIGKMSRRERREHAKLLKSEEERKSRRPTRYPAAANSFFTKRAVLPEHVIEPKKDKASSRKNRLGK